MPARVETICPRDTLAKAYSLMQEKHFRRLPVMESGKLVGIVTDRRQDWGYFENTKVTGAMTHDPITISPHVTAEDAARLMLEHKIGRIPVVQDSELVGIVTTTDVMRGFPSRGSGVARSSGELRLRPGSGTNV